MRPIQWLLLMVYPVLASCAQVEGGSSSANLSGGEVVYQEGEYVFNRAGERGGLRVTFPEPSIVRLQHYKSEDHHLPDSHYGMVVDHDIETGVSTTSEGNVWVAETEELSVEVDRESLHVTVISKQSGAVLREAASPSFSDNEMAVTFGYDESERFYGLGQPPLGNRDRLEITGEVVRRNYAEDGIPTRGAQGNLLVPLLLSSEGYGVFFNTTFPNEFLTGAFDRVAATFEHDGSAGEIDYYVFAGPAPADVLDQYTMLTGRPLLPPKWAFGLQLSDNEPGQGGLIDAEWWKQEVNALYEAGYPLDHMVFDNDWRAGSGGWSGSWFEFSPERYPDPKGFADWHRDLGLTVTLDLNMNVANDSAGWKESYNIPVTDSCPDENSDSYPDYTNPEMREWVWNLFSEKALAPELGYPGEGLWMDETDGVWTNCVNPTARLHNGRTWQEVKNEYYLHIAEAVFDGWTGERTLPSAGSDTRVERPYIWVRGGTAGGQRYATHWTGDIFHDSSAMEEQLIALQASGLAAYPYFNHDAGGFVSGKDSVWTDMGGTLTDAVYTDWAMAFGSFTPIWRPHGYASPRWPTRRSQNAQKWARLYATNRYEMMPYIYSAAIEAAETGMPMARAMLIEYPDDRMAWDTDNQYMWGGAMLVAPSINMSGRAEVQSIWLPKEPIWYDYWSNKSYAGDQIIQHRAEYGYMPVFVKAGAIIPKAPYALNTASQPKDELTLRVYAGADGSYTLREDDGESLDYKSEGTRVTRVTLSDRKDDLGIVVAKSSGRYVGAPEARRYSIEVVGLSERPSGISVQSDGTDENVSGVHWDDQKKELRFEIGRHSVNSKVSVTVTK